MNDCIDIMYVKTQTGFSHWITQYLLMFPCSSLLEYWI